MKSIPIAVFVLAAFTVLAACNRDAPGKGGPAEKAGREVDRAMGKAGQAVEKAGREMQDAAKGK